MKQSRLDYMDLAKGIGILAVILGHVYKNTVFGTLLYSFHLPLFFLISGYFFHYIPDFWVFLKKKLRNYLIPYAGCSRFLLPSILFIQKEIWQAPVNFFLNLWSRNATPLCGF